ncbi:Signal peptidase subunit [Giardia muris]|uniref:Signal peptidase complex subunit 3 n=1 Tax=Giardia muris TaxID=5742 RepID=A0A4Z1T6Y1_GIAMU|nr:Signal peptidase subunit [Giardia muris]|eukprot:TNJ29823.1 Signal peptidase subunit [Giardia muris]
MHTWYVRLYSLLTFSIVATFGLMGCIYLTSYASTPTSIQSLRGVEVSQARAIPTRRSYNGINQISTIPAHEGADLVLDLKYDLNGLFTWTTKQVYIAVVASWKDPAGDQEQVVWDKVVGRRDPHEHEGKLPAKYPLSSYNLQKGLTDTDEFLFSIVVQTMPYAGLFRTERYSIPEAFKDVFRRS